MQYLKKISLWAFVVLFMPVLVQAENITDLKSLIADVKNILNSIIPLLFGLALVGFIWGVIKYIYAAGPTKLAEARNYIIFSIVAIAVMLSVWGLAFMLKNTFFENSSSPYSQVSNTNSNSDTSNTYDPYGQEPRGAGQQCTSSNDCSYSQYCSAGVCVSRY